jgi:division protein CdvB (Snf7/Vps24/ESCRT-III family)
MTAKMDNSFINFVDFIDVALEAYSTAPKKLFDKMMRMIISTFHSQEVELEKLQLAIDEMNTIPTDDLDDFYDTVLDTIEDVKLFKKKIEPLITKDILFLELQEKLDSLHTALVKYMDRMGQLEVRILQSA